MLYAFIAVAVVQWLDTHRVARQIGLLRAGVGYRKGKLAQQVRGTAGSPAAPGGEQQLRVARLIRGPGQTEGYQQRVAIVQSRTGNDADALACLAGRVGQRAGKWQVI